MMRKACWAAVLLQTCILVVAKDFPVYAALGDSYAAGAGLCGGFDSAYPVMIANDTRLDFMEFLNLACGGASTASVKKTQVPHIGDADVVTITVGGNEIEFFAVLNACVYEWLPSTSCEKEMTRAKTLAQSDTLLKSFNSMIESTMQHSKPGAKVLITGYARFFNDTTSQCDHASFSRKHADNLLTKEVRRNFNQMVDAINFVIKSAAEVHGAIYVDIDPAFEGHRFCEANVVEPSDSDDTWFFNLKYDGNQARLASQALLQTTFPNPFKDFLDLVKTFHPTRLGHKAIAEVVMEELVGKQAGLRVSD